MVCFNLVNAIKQPSGAGWHGGHCVWELPPVCTQAADGSNGDVTEVLIGSGHQRSPGCPAAAAACLLAACPAVPAVLGAMGSPLEQHQANASACPSPTPKDLSASSVKAKASFLARPLFVPPQCAFQLPAFRFWSSGAK